MNIGEFSLWQGQHFRKEGNCLLNGVETIDYQFEQKNISPLQLYHSKYQFHIFLKIKGKIKL